VRQGTFTVYNSLFFHSQRVKAHNKAHVAYHYCV